MSERPLIFRPLTIDDIVGETVTLLLKRLPQILAIAALANLPVLLWQTLSLIQADEWIAPPRFQTITEVSALSAFANYVASGRTDMRLLAAITVAGLCGMLQSAAITWYAAQQLTKPPDSPPGGIREALQHALQHFGDIVIGTLVPALAIAALARLTDINIWGTLLFIGIVAGIYPRFLFVTSLVVLERESGLRALWHSWRLSWRSFGHVFGMWLLMEFIIAIALLPPTLLIGLSSVTFILGWPQRLLSYAIGNLAIFIVEPVRSVVLMLLYFDLRRRFERRRAVELQR